MRSRSRIAVVTAVGLLVVLAGTTLATRAPAIERPSPQLADEGEELPGETAIQRVVERLAANGIDAEPDAVRELAAEHGIGGAVRMLAWSAEGISLAEVREMRADGRGWGEIARDLGVHPGIGSIMGNGGGHGRDAAPGQRKDRGADD